MGTGCDEISSAGAVSVGSEGADRLAPAASGAPVCWGQYEGSPGVLSGSTVFRRLFFFGNSKNRPDPKPLSSSTPAASTIRLGLRQAEGLAHGALSEPLDFARGKSKGDPLRPLITHSCFPLDDDGIVVGCGPYTSSAVVMALSTCSPPGGRESGFASSSLAGTGTHDAQANGT